MRDAAFWRGRRVLLTGHTGFKGSWAALWLVRAGAEVTGLALPPESQPALYDLARAGEGLDHHVADLRDAEAVAGVVAEADPEVVLHLAAQPIVRRAVREPAATFAANVQGTVNLLNALRPVAGLRAVLVVTTDKVYRNNGGGHPFRETDTLGGNEPYSASKAAAEIATQTFAETYFSSRGVPVATARGGNVIGGGDFGEDRLIPDIVRASTRGEALRLRHPDSTRPWQHVLDCLSGYLAYAEALAQDVNTPPALNFGPAAGSDVPVRRVAEAMLAALGEARPWIPDVGGGAHEVPLLALDSSLARRTLGWSDRLTGSRAIDWTADWYKAYRAGADMRAVTLDQIAGYQALAPGAAVAAMVS